MNIEELEHELKHSREFNDRHLQTIEKYTRFTVNFAFNLFISLEIENEKFREENHKQQVIIENLNEQLNKYQRNAAGLSNTELICSKSAGSDAGDQSVVNRKGRSATEHPKSFIGNKSEQANQQADFMNSESMISDHKQLFTIQESKTDEHWFNQIENLREKVELYFNRFLKIYLISS